MENNIIDFDRFFLISIYYKTQDKVLLWGQKEGKINTVMSNVVLKKSNNEMIRQLDILNFVAKSEPNVLPQTIAFTGIYEFKTKSDLDTFFGENIQEKLSLENGKTNS